MTKQEAKEQIRVEAAKYVDEIKEIIEESDMNKKYFKGKKWIMVRFSNKGAYFIHKNTRYYLDTFMTSYWRETGYHAYLALNNFGGMVIKLSDDGEAVKVDYTY